MAIAPQSEKAKRVMAFLRKELDIPQEVIGFEVSFGIDEMITVKNMSYYPLDDPPKDGD